MHRGLLAAYDLFDSSLYCMSAITAICFVLLIAFIGGHVAKHLGYPRIVGQLLLSLVFAVPAVQDLHVTGGALEVVETLSELGAILLVFLTGFDIDLVSLKKSARSSVAIALFAGVFPFLLGAALGYLLGYSWLTSVVLGGCLSISANSTKTAILMELKKVKTRIATMMIGASFIDELIGILLLTVLFLFAEGGSIETFALFLVRIAIFAAVIYAAFILIPRVVHHLEEEHTEDVAFLNVILVMALILALAAEVAGAGAVLGAAFAGVIMQKSFLKKIDREREEELLRLFAFAVIVPFFFVSVGLNINVYSIMSDPLLVALVTVVALIGKVLGTVLATPFVENTSLRQMTLIGWGMNARGMIELVLAKLAFDFGLIPQELFSAIVFMAIFTTILFPFVLRRMVRTTPKIMK